MKRIIISVLALVLMAGTALGQTQARKKVAVVPTIGTVSDDVKGAVQDALEEGIANSGGYTLVARGTAYEQALKEFKFQETGAVDDNQLGEFGHAVGADFVCYASLRKIGSNYRISYKMINVATSEVPKASSKSTQNGDDDLLDIINIIAGEMFGGRESGGITSRNSAYSSNTRRHSAEPEMVEVEGGTFLMGCSQEQGSCDDDESPLHSVTVSSFRIGKHEITQAQWKLIMGGNPSNFKGDNLPVESVSWNEVQEFISRLNAATGKSYRLPTEAEWEYAARGGKRSGGYMYSGSNNLYDVAWFTDNSGGQTRPTGTKKANELGIHDMSGNVWEWCLDWYGSYSASSQQDPMGASNGSSRVNRGGSYRDDASECRVAYRDNDSPGGRYAYLGFRVVLP